VPKLDIFTSKEFDSDLMMSIKLSTISLLNEFLMEVFKVMFLAISLFFKDIDLFAQ
jgi:hypothetical protein